ncbi:hypothetical protein [Bacillus cereus group sp. MG11]|uniref:hypothetical protein n=1 Tax=Bacillus cereus group sp. MG11 TaxID=3040248 RepID=UPI0033912409
MRSKEFVERLVYRGIECNVHKITSNEMNRKGFLTVTDAPFEVSLNHGFYVNIGAIKSCIDLYFKRKELELNQ